MIEKININLLEGNKSYDTECETQTIPYEDIELLAKKINEIIELITPASQDKE